MVIGLMIEGEASKGGEKNALLEIWCTRDTLEEERELEWGDFLSQKFRLLRI